MNAPLGRCPVHGLVPALGFDIGPGGQVEIVNSTGACPRCWRSIPILDGIYRSLAEGLVEFISSTEWTPARVTQVRRSVKRAQKRVRTEGVESALHEVARANTALAQQLEAQLAVQANGAATESKERRQDRFWIILAGVLQLLSLLHDVTSNGQDLTPEVVEHIVQQAVTEAHEKYELRAGEPSATTAPAEAPTTPPPSETLTPPTSEGS